MNPPLLVEIYSSREGLFAWSVTFNDLDLSRMGKADTFTAALAAVHGAIAAGQCGFKARFGRPGISLISPAQ